MSTGEQDDLSPNKIFGLEGKVALVTGGSRGLGRQMALGFAAAGAAVVVCSRDLASCELVVGELRAAGAQATAIAAHVGRWDGLDALVEGAREAFGSIDILVNNAGMSPRYDQPSSVGEELFDKTIAVNLKGPFRLCALVGEYMAEHDGGSIINIGSTGSMRPNKNIIPYAAAKAGLVAMTQGFADAFGPTVRVNALLPGRFRTDVTHGWSQDMLSNKGSRLQRIGEPREIVGAALYLASNASAYATGTVSVVDGGMF
ncbi:SDR family NAD(P)-dependent oxidoreductase [Nocardia fusca]|uniref:SDR family NAD(P)-dependent oxidoreductase n=1 Tax=Nocardia fusca TaxID=941183 RepID=UPI0007A74064|nr:glucose 1-dehydrogenase [Nocardia fusca]